MLLKHPNFKDFNHTAKSKTLTTAYHRLHISNVASFTPTLKYSPHTLVIFAATFIPFQEVPIVCSTFGLGLNDGIRVQNLIRTFYQWCGIHVQVQTHNSI